MSPSIATMAACANAAGVIAEADAAASNAAYPSAEAACHYAQGTPERALFIERFAEYRAAFRDACDAGRGDDDPLAKWGGL